MPIENNVFHKIKMLFRRDVSEGAPEESHDDSGPKKLTFMVKKEVKEHLEQGRASLNQGQIDEAIQHYRTAVSADPSCALSHFNLAYALHEKGRFEDAREAYLKSVELEPTCSLFLENYARLQFDTLDYRESARHFQRASMVGNIQPISVGLWGRSLFEQGLFEHAVETFESLLDRDKQPLIQLGAQYWLALAHIKLGRIAAARRLAEAILSAPDVDPKILYDLGEHFIEVRCISLARSIFERISKGSDDALSARLRLDDIKKIEDQIDEALPRLFDGDEERLLHQIHALREFGNDRISKALLALIDSHSAPVRESVIRYQTNYGYNAAEKIAPLLQDEIVYVREAAYDYFEKLDFGGSLDQIKPGLNDPHPTVRKKAARLIGRFGGVDMLPELEMIYTDPRNKECRDEIRAALASIKRRFQRKQDKLSRMNVLVPKNGADYASPRDFKFWLLLMLQILVIGYLIYYIFFKF